MKVKYSLLIWSLILVLICKPMPTTARAKTAINLAQDKLIQLYDQGMSSIDKEYAEKSKNLSENILKDMTIQEASSQELKLFKQNITDFLNKYPFHKRYNLYNRLVNIFSELTLPYYTQDIENTDRKYIKNLMQKLGYEKMTQKYDEDLGKFVEDKLLKEFEKFAKNLDKKDIKLQENLLNWCQETKKCQNYTCFEEQFDLFTDILYSPKDKLFDAIYVKVDKINVKYAIQIKKLLLNILKDRQLQELNDKLKDSFIKDINVFIKNFTTSNDIGHLDDLLEYFKQNISEKYYNNLYLKPQDHDLLKDIFEKQGFLQIKAKNQYFLNRLIKHDLQQIFKDFQNSLNSQPTEDDVALLQWYENVKNLKTVEERKEAFNKLFELHDN